MLPRYLLFVSVAVVALGCSRIAREFPRYPVEEFDAADQLRAAQDAYRLASRAQTRGDQAGLAKKGVFYAERCAKLEPRVAACYFYEALNTGLYYQAKVLGYPSGMARIDRAARKVISLDSRYEEGGGYRILGKLYLEAPSFNLGSNQVTRDLEKSRHYLEEAVAVAPHYPENHLFLAETLTALQAYDQARHHLERAREQMRQQRFPNEDEKSWRKLLKKLERKLR